MAGPSNETEEEKLLLRAVLAMERIATLFDSVVKVRNAHVGTTDDGTVVTVDVGNYIAVNDV